VFLLSSFFLNGFLATLRFGLQNLWLQLLQTNTDNQVVECTTKAVHCARKIALDDNRKQVIQEALEHLMVLKGVGPATASALLSLIRPDVFCYMYDEVIDCFEENR
jgi:hypothetical protein